MRQKRASEPENHERWLVSYADFITLLFAFFVMMFASTQSDKLKAKEVSESVREALEHVVLGARIQCGGRLVQNQELGVAQVGARQRDLLPFPAGKLHAAFEAPSKLLPVTERQPLDHPVGLALLCRHLHGAVVRLPVADPSHRDVLPRAHLVAHEVLEDHTDLAVQIFRL